MDDAILGRVRLGRLLLHVLSVLDYKEFTELCGSCGVLLLEVPQLPGNDTTELKSVEQLENGEKVSSS